MSIVLIACKVNENKSLHLFLQLHDFLNIDEPGGNKGYFSQR
jgi:hypothetical protein